MSFDDEEKVVGRIRSWLAAKANEGPRCPCCDQLVKRYRRKLHSSMAATLCWLVRVTRCEPETFVHVGRRAPRTVLRGKDFGLLRHWRLIEPGTQAGAWRPTPLGRVFVGQHATVPRYAVILLGRLERLEGDSITIRQALGDAFSFEELMRERPADAQ